MSKIGRMKPWLFKEESIGNKSTLVTSTPLIIMSTPLKMFLPSQLPETKIPPKPCTTMEPNELVTRNIATYAEATIFTNEFEMSFSARVESPLILMQI